ncbi:phosphoglycerate mutase-like protein [Saitoella complicata NRRL Y-17804]|nr:phosphoglycerate mutase-like protein [Saitoella complicata NRRL Y-17804]ODQ52023.1 phosphoglycerate mutase-like protein [Saitoella complicata NRRL Y-17804]
MKTSLVLLSAATALGMVSAADSDVILGVALFGRHGDRTPKILGNTKLTALGKNQVYSAGSYIRNYYLSNTSSSSLTSDATISISNLEIQAPDTSVLTQTAFAFAQGLFPPSSSIQTETLANGTEVSTPLDGYQYPNLEGIPSDAPEAYINEGTTQCPQYDLETEYYSANDVYTSTLSSSQSLYDSIAPLVQGIGGWNSSTINFGNAYKIFDYLNYGSVHNETIASQLSSETLDQLRILADQHEFALNYNATDPAYNIGGRSLMSEVLTNLNASAVESQKISYAAGSYANFMSLFALMNLTAASADFYGLPGYASTFSFELRAPTNTTTDPASMSIRFLFRNGTAVSSELTAFPLFGGSEVDVPYETFVKELKTRGALMTTRAWCNACASHASVCTAFLLDYDTNAYMGREYPVSPLGAGFIGAGVMAVVMTLLVFVLFSVVRRLRGGVDKLGGGRRGSFGSDETKVTRVGEMAEEKV